MMLKRKLYKINKAIGLIIPKVIVDSMELGENEELEITFDRNKITLTRLNPPPLTMTVEIHRPDFKRLGK